MLIETVPKQRERCFFLYEKHLSLVIYRAQNLPSLLFSCTKQFVIDEEQEICNAVGQQLVYAIEILQIRENLLIGLQRN